MFQFLKAQYLDSACFDPVFYCNDTGLVQSLEPCHTARPWWRDTVARAGYTMTMVFIFVAAIS